MRHLLQKIKHKSSNFFLIPKWKFPTKIYWKHIQKMPKTQITPTKWCCKSHFNCCDNIRGSPFSWWTNKIYNKIKSHKITSSFKLSWDLWSQMCNVMMFIIDFNEFDDFLHIFNLNRNQVTTVNKVTPGLSPCLG